MDSSNLSGAQSLVLNDPVCVRELPEEILEVIRNGQQPQFLDAVARASTTPSLTARIFTRFERIFADICARLITNSANTKDQDTKIIATFARILPFAPHLSVYLEKYLSVDEPSENKALQIPRLKHIYDEHAGSSTVSLLPDAEVQQLLLAAFRLLNFDRTIYAKSISETRIQPFLLHESIVVRYLALRLLCQLRSASDSKLEAMIDQYVGRDQAIMGQYDGVTIDYGFLSLYEQERENEVKRLREEVEKKVEYITGPLHIQGLSPLVAQFSATILPRPNGPPSRPTTLVATRTTCQNQERFAQALISPSPILIHGLSGSGKTSLVNDFARELGMDSTMVTLHLNEQTDAKMLIGMYATGATPGSFKWRPGVLTTAVKEGRWVFIEDLDRAPNEVISVILPLIERGELVVPNRGETIRAARGFRLIASIRTSRNMSGQETAPAMHMLGARLWQRVPVHMPSQLEFQEIINGTHPILHKFLPGIIAVYERLYALSQQPSFASRTKTSLGRPISPRDLLKWCRRLDSILIAAGSRSGDEPISDATKDEMFMEAADCFGASLQTEDARKIVISAIAEEMHIPSQRVEHYLEAHIPKYDDNESQLAIGRVVLNKRKFAGRVAKPAKKRPFANTNHSKRLLEQVGVAVKLAEPILLVGETGIGKTTVVQQLADSLGYKLTAVNLSQQSEVGDLLGGFKPVNVRSLAIPLKEEFDDLFSATGISASKNQKYLEQLGKFVAKGQWSRASKLWHEAPKMFERILAQYAELDAKKSRDEGEQPTKRRKTENKLQSLLQLKPRWERFSQHLEQFDQQLQGGSKGFAFTFVEGNIVKAARNGEWVLLDEINLASPDTLESIADLLHSGPGSTPSILLSETGEIERVKAHPEFRIFGAMNPATDVGKRDLPMGLRSRFTEIYVDSPDKSIDDLLAVIRAYLKGTSSNDERAAHDVARLYINTKRLADEKRIVDGANQVPHFSLRTLTRTLSYVMEIAPAYGLRRALYEGFSMSFLTLLDRASEQMLVPLIDHHLLESHGNPKALLSQTPKHPEDGKQYVRFMNKKRDRQYWMLQGREVPQEQVHYIITPFVERNMLNLVRATSTRRFPVLVQGPTSAGKTSMIEYLAKYSGNKFVRINNHEHTDLQEYLGTYVSGSDGQLRFQEGLLVQALRQGHWIVLDELNLAPTDVLEALNRLLDDNRELLIPETQEIVRPHENFMLFATQNPPGLYGGRKTLSRAFRNRFLELHFDDIPEDELEFILEKRSQKVAPSDCRRIVSVYKELSRLRQSSRLFEQKDSFATLRDLFRWAMRDADNREQLAANGYMLLAERVRKPEERTAVKEIIETVMKVKIDTNVLYDGGLSPEIVAYNRTSNNQGVVWTQAMRRLYVLVAHALRNNEPVLLVGETGCGKTTVCQMLAEAFTKELHIVNAHQNTETGDLIGAQRPVRNRGVVSQQLTDDILIALRSCDVKATAETDLDALLAAYKALSAEDIAKVPQELQNQILTNQVKARALFEWSDGSLVQAMRDGQYFLLDEISLADDSVLERLNSVLESQRTILLAEKGVEDSFVQATDGFQFFATMNPGGDYGKRELSPALRNRFTEIWVPALSERQDVLQIVETKLIPNAKPFAGAMVDFAEWFGQTYRSSSATSISVRDVLAWVTFINGCGSTDMYFAVLQGAAMVYIDTLGANPAALLAINPESILQERAKCLEQLSLLLSHDVLSMYNSSIALVNGEESLAIGQFSIPKTTNSATEVGFAFEAPTTKMNAMRVMRALQVRKPILIEGSPGVGKTTLITALAKAAGKPLTRINLSEQTDLMDLFGSDVPVEGAEAGHFAWRDAPFLQAMQSGDWVLLDEMNLASQSVLEGLNACLDHRGEVYISELDQTFKRHPNFSVFAAQNPHHQGGGRKGLPASFVNRFTVVYADVFRNDDLTMICKENFPDIPDTVMSNLISFVSQLENEVVHKRRFGSQGGPWEFNLRDILRWLKLLTSKDPLLAAGEPADFLDLIFRQRFRTAKDRQEIGRIFSEAFGKDLPLRHYFHNLSADAYQVGIGYLRRDALVQRVQFPSPSLTDRLAEVESVMICVQQNLPCILVGPSGSGKTTILQHVAAASGTALTVFPLNADIDTMDLVGGFEQVDPQRAASAFVQDLRAFVEARILAAMPAAVPAQAISIVEHLKTDEEYTKKYFLNVYDQLKALNENTSLPELEGYLQSCKALIERPITVDNARFEWVDGVLITALEQGKWLVLDNANLCSSSVLDRLNSLLEPNGFLSINEHCGPDGEPKIVRPHPNFRLFMTMDARFGELSRAMRNRAIEIFIDHLDEEKSITTKQVVSIEASSRKYETLLKAIQTNAGGNEASAGVAQVGLDTLSWRDLPYLPRFADALKNGLITSFTEAHAANMLSLFQQHYQVLTSADEKPYVDAIGVMYDSLAQSLNLPQGFKDAQSLHALQNSPLVPLLLQTSESSQPYWTALLLELKVEAAARYSLLDQQAKTLATLKPSQMTRLQRSMVHGRVPAVAKDSTVGVATFLKDILDALVIYLRGNITSPDTWKSHKNALMIIMRYWDETFLLSSSIKFEESAFQAHLSIGRDAFLGLTDKSVPIDTQTDTTQLVRHLSDRLRSEFSTGFKLTTGLSMETLWVQLRPTPISRIETLRMLAQMEQLASRFDALRWKTSVPVAELGSIMDALVKTYHLVLTSDADVEQLVQTIGSELEALETKTGVEGVNIEPFFAEQFEALRQYHALQTMRASGNSVQTSSDTSIAVLANHPTASMMLLSSATASSRALQSMGYLWGQSGALQPVQATISPSLLHKLHNIGDVDLKSLKLLETELPILGEKIASASELLCRDQIQDLNDLLLELLVGIIRTHDEALGTQFSQWVEQQRGVSLNGDASTELTISSVPTHLQQVITNHFEPAVKAICENSADITNKYKMTSLAWVHFAVGCLVLFVPDRPFDPDKGQWLEREQHVRTIDVFQGKIGALRHFEQLFSGQSSNLRIELVEEDLVNLGQPKEALQKIYRPETSELDQLQGEFNNLLTAVVKSAPHDMLRECLSQDSDRNMQELKLLQGNVQQIIRRLSERFGGYSDMTVPIVGMLRCLQVGLSVAELSTDEESTDSVAIANVTSSTPFLGGSPMVVTQETIDNHPLEFLSSIAAASNVEGIKALDVTRRQALFNAFHACYEQWTKKLDADRKDAESKTGLYRFRGSAEDEDEMDQEQFNELFPSFESEQSEDKNAVHAARTTKDTTVDLADIHKNIFIKDTSPTDSILSLIRTGNAKVGSLCKDKSSFKDSKITTALLPGALLSLDDQVLSLTSTALNDNTYNFYTDANLPEARKLVALIHQIQHRFRELQNVDEIGHMQPLEDVLVACKELLEFRHTEPVAKIITKVEKVHTYMHEWQFGGWASRANSALALYDQLTQTIVNWRRLELSTWARLFDMEDKACYDNAKSWWFVAYQVVVAGPLSISESVDELKSYAQKLLQDLEAYFGTAIQGQLLQRLELLKQLQKHLELLMLDIPNMSIINTALSNFIDVYSRFEKPVIENLRKGRQTLEKAMKDVLLLASWKDTNIVALRDSAKRSHHKLFKLVRKYRALLGQPMDIILKQGLPDGNEPGAAAQLTAIRDILPLVDQAALDLCAKSVPGWSKKSKRFVNISKTVSMMDDNSHFPETALDTSEYLESFLANLIESSAELQKATPSVLTEDNKIEVKHLKTRKRKLFADTLKELRQMGVKYNLGVNALEKQESLSIVLATTSHLVNHAVIDRDGIEYYYHKMLDLIPRAREATRQHSEDLSGAEVARSAGYLEGLLQVIVKQRNTLSESIQNSIALDKTVGLAQALWAPSTYAIKHSTGTSSHERTLRWLPNILRVSLELMRVHSKLGKQDTQACQAIISPWVDRFTVLEQRWDVLPTIPSMTTSTEHEVLISDINDALKQLSAEVNQAIGQYSGLSFVLEQILPWTEVTTDATSMSISNSDIATLDKKVASICDAVFVAIEKLNKSMAELPASTEDASWLIKNEACLSENIRVMYSNELTSKVQQAFALLRTLDLENTSVTKTASAVFAVSLPIFQQYANVLRQCIARYGSLHRSTCKMSYVLAKSFAEIASRGFCTPSEKSDAQDGQTEKLEGGTGLGDGEGADDISKDIGDDENLDELAQEPNKGDKEEIEDEKDAVDMADGEMEGEMGDAEEKGEDEEGSGDEESGDEMDEETGDVDDLDPNAVDEKMWDGDGEEAEKDQEGDDSKGKQSKDEQVAAQEENQKEGAEGDVGEDGEEEEEEEGGDEQGEEVKQDDIEKHDPHAQEEEALDLPDDMDLDGDGKSEGSVDGDDDGMDDFPNLDDEGKEGEAEEEASKDNNPDGEGEDAEGQEDQEMEEELDVVDLDEEKEGEDGDKTEDAGEKAEDEPEQEPDENQDGLLQDRTDDANADPDAAAPSEAQGVGQDQDDDQTENQDPSSKAQREDGGKGGESSEEKQAAAQDGEKGRQADGEAPAGEDEDTADASDAKPFKKLGDALERWHRQQKQIQQSSERKDQQQDQEDQTMDMDTENKEFEHLQDENAEADTQALGTATEDQARALDESMAVDEETNEMPEQFQPDEVELDDAVQTDGMDLEEPEVQQDKEVSDAYEGRAGAMIQQAQEDKDQTVDDFNRKAQPELEDDVEEVDTQLSTTHLEDTTSLSISRSPEDARQLWSHYESLTRDLSLSLTEQLRLILAPTLATKMRGDFRTGKRLNIKRIIPYIASSFKRDKIWMRRSVPSKRSYQIMLAVDDSKSMGDSGSGSLAFETLVMISKSLSMLEVGEICVLGFGEEVRVAHEFDTPFSSDAGPKVFQNFGFEQNRTDVTKLIRESIELFRTARAKASSAPADLWQLQLILSDGVCDSSEHEPIRRLLREAIEERIMMVFVIVDDVKNKKKGESVMDLKEAKFIKNEMTGQSQVKIERYLDTFPFQYYLIVSDVRELPGVLATLLRQWFSEVVDSSG